MSQPVSLNLRLILASLLILPIFLGLTAWTLDRAYYLSLVDGQQESMYLQQLLLSRAADWDGQRWQVSSLDDIRFSLADAGLYGFILGRNGEVLWQSPSVEAVGEAGQLLSSSIPTYLQASVLREVGDSVFSACDLAADYFCHAKLVAWGSTGPETVFLVVETRQSVTTELSGYRETLLWLLLATAVILVAAQLFIVYWGLRPLRALTEAIRALEKGDSDRLSEQQPRELRPLANNLNQLLESERRRRQRVRNTMDRLAHVLKSPLMLLRNSKEQGPQLRQLVDEQVSRMQGIVEGELSRARLDGRQHSLLGKPVLVRPLIERIALAYSKLPRPHCDQDVQIDLDGVTPNAVFFGEERDFQDLFGSILENSMRHCRQQILVQAEELSDDSGHHLLLSIGDDGAGIADGQEAIILQRGARADSVNEVQQGHGIGLAIVVEIVSAYGGSIEVGRSPSGGALFKISLPGRP